MFLNSDIHLLVLFLSLYLPSVHPLLTPTVIANFSSSNWIENLVVRSTTPSLLVTSIPAPDVYLVPTTESQSSQDTSLITSFPNATSCSGITELGRDIFYVLVGNFSLTLPGSTPGTYSLWELDLTTNHHSSLGAENGNNPWTTEQYYSGITTRKIAAVPGGGFLNGLTALSPLGTIVLAADSLNGCVWSIDVGSGSVEKIITHPAMQPVPGSGFEIGINGIKIYNGYLYFTNSNQATVNRVEIDPGSGRAVGDVETLYKGTSETLSPDDIAIDKEGNVWLANNALGQIVVFKRKGDNKWVMEVVVDDMNVLRPTAVAFGLGKEELSRSTLYVSNANGVVAKIDTADAAS